MDIKSPSLNGINDFRIIKTIDNQFILQKLFYIEYTEHWLTIAQANSYKYLHNILSLIYGKENKFEVAVCFMPYDHDWDGYN